MEAGVENGGMVMIRRFNVYWDMGDNRERVFTRDCTIDKLKEMIKAYKEDYPDYTLIKVEEEVRHTLEIDIEEFDDDYNHPPTVYK